jgi:hypothetical protein
MPGGTSKVGVYGAGDAVCALAVRGKRAVRAV